MTDDAVFAPGTLLAGKFRVVRRLGEGGMGAVYEIEHELTKHRRALKLLHSEMAQSPSIVERFLREASAAGRVGNPHIVESFDAGVLERGEPYLVMELLRGEPLANRVLRGPMTVPDVVDLIGQACIGVAAAHAAGIVHRDLKPDNLFIVDIDGRPFVKILDFGISKFDAAKTGGMALTTEGAAMGTPYYMSPEQIRGVGNLDARADVYALGVILYECLGGRRPFESDVLTHLAVLIHAGQAHPLEQLRPDLPNGFADLVRHAMMSDRERRMQTAVELRAALERFGSISFRTTSVAISSLPPLATVPARSMATSGIGVSMRTPPPQTASKRGVLVASLVGGALVLGAGGFLALRSSGSAGAAAAGSANGPEATSNVAPEPPRPPPVAPPPAVIATEKASPPPEPPASASAAHSPAVGVRSAATPPPPATPARPAGRAEQRGLAKDNPFK